MKCKVCGVEFHETDIAVMEEGEEPICDSCAFEIYKEENRTEH